MRLIGDIPLTGAERTARYRKAHPEKCKDAGSTWAISNPEKYKEGMRRRNKTYEAKNPHRSRDRNAKFRRTPQGAATYLYSNAKRRAREGGLEFTITKAWILERLLAGECQVTGMPFVIDNGRKPWAPSLDKTDPSGGYTPENTKVVVWMYNTCKWQFTHDDVVNFCKAVLTGGEKCAS